MMGPVVSGPVNNRARAVGGPKEGEEELQREGCFVRFVGPEAVIARRVREGAETIEGEGEKEKEKAS